MPRTHSFLLLALFLLVLSCAGTVKPPESPGEPAAADVYRGPVDLKILKDSVAFRHIESLRSQVGVTVYKDGGREEGSFKGIFAYKSPGMIRLRLLSPLGVTAMDMLVANGLLQVYIPHNGTLYEGEAPLLNMPEDAFYGMEVEKESYVLYAFKPSSGVRSGKVMQIAGKFTFHPLTLWNTGISVYKEGRRYVSLLLGDYAGRVPHFIRFSFPNGFVMEMALENPSVDEEVPGSYFDPISSRGKEVLPIESSEEFNGFLR